MKILTLDTGSVTDRSGATLAALEIGDDARLAGLARIEAPRALGAQLFEAADGALQSAGWKLGELDALAIGAGPGSWTSLRIGFAAFKTWAATLQKPLLPIPSFDALASATQRALWNTLSDENEAATLAPHLLVTLAPCHSQSLYGKLFRLEDDFLAVSQGERIAPTRDLLDAAFSQALADAIGAPLLLVGGASDEAADYLTQRGETALFTRLEVPAEAVAVEIGLLASYALEGGEVPPLEEAAPLYLAPSSAERLRP